MALFGDAFRKAVDGVTIMLSTLFVSDHAGTVVPSPLSLVISKCPAIDSSATLFSEFRRTQSQLSCVTDTNSANVKSFGPLADRLFPAVGVSRKWVCIQSERWQQAATDHALVPRHDDFPLRCGLHYS